MKCENCGGEFSVHEIEEGLCAECLADKIETESELWVTEDF